MAEDLDHLLSGHHFLDVGVQLAQVFLLPLEVIFAPLAAVPDVEEHPAVAHHHDQGEPPVEEEEKGQRAHHLNEALD